MDRGAWRATVHGVAKTWTRPSTQAPTEIHSGVFANPEWRTFTDASKGKLPIEAVKVLQEISCLLVSM